MNNRRHPRVADTGLDPSAPTGRIGYFDAPRMPRDVALAEAIFEFASEESDRIRLLVDKPRTLFERR